MTASRALAVVATLWICACDIRWLQSDSTKAAASKDSVRISPVVVTAVPEPGAMPVDTLVGLALGHRRQAAQALREQTGRTHGVRRGRRRPLHPDVRSPRSLHAGTPGRNAAATRSADRLCGDERRRAAQHAAPPLRHRARTAER